MTSIELAAPAKVNLYLKVLNKRSDSYHNLITVFERITLADRIKISRIPEGVIVSSDIPITADPKDNLVYKAARIILEYKGIKSGVKIAIKKNIPIAAGLGGGSSDAAAVLIGIKRLFKLDIAVKTLMELGAGIGADVPFFILETGFALGRMKGEKLKAIDSKTRFWHLVICPDFHVAAKEIYEAFDASTPPDRGLKAADTRSGSVSTLKHARPLVRQAHYIPSLCRGIGRGSRRVDSPDLPERSRGKCLPRYLTKPAGDVKIQTLLQIPMDFGTAESMLSNDLEDVVVSKRKIIGTIIKRLAYSLGKKAIVSGSGPSVFCLCRTGKEASTAKKRFLSGMPASERKDWRIFVAGTYRD